MPGPSARRYTYNKRGKCGKPMSGYWIHADGTKTAVCDMCAMSVMVNYMRGRPKFADEGGRETSMRMVVLVFRPHCKGPAVTASTLRDGSPNTRHQPPPAGGRLDGVVGPLN